MFVSAAADGGEGEIASVEFDLEDLRQASYRLLLAVTALLAWLSFMEASLRGQQSNWPVFTALVLTVGLVASAFLRSGNPRQARELLALSLAGAFLTAVLGHPGGETRYFGALVLLGCTGMLSAVEHALLTVLLSLGLLSLQVYAPAAADPGHLVRVLVFMGLVSGTSWLARRHLNLALTWASQSASRAIKLNDGLRQRQFQLNRALHAMDEANARLALANERLAAARKLADEARQAKVRFAASVSHELRTPLNIIVGFTEIMYSTPQAYPDAVLSAPFLVDLGAVYRNTRHLQRLVDDVLDLAQLEAGKFALQLVDTDLAAVIEEAVDAIRNLAVARGLGIETCVAPDLPHVRADRTRIKQVILNLLSNAVRHTERGSIAVTATCEGREVLCSVADTGAGIPEEQQHRLFEEFEQIGFARSARRHGSGLGLAISRRLLREHGGRIWVESELGAGSIFTFAIPMLDDDALRSDIPVVRRPPAKSSQPEGDVALLLTPSLVATRLFSRYLAGHRCVSTSDVSQALRQIGDLQPRGIVVDAALGTGVVTRVSRALEKRSIGRAPLIVCPMPGPSQADCLGKIMGYLTKPVTRQDLQDALRTIGGEVDTILVVDDEEDVLRLFTHYLQDDVTRPYRVSVAHHGREALHAMRERRPDLVLLDLVMPVMDGYQVLQEMQRAPDLSGIPVVVVSGQDVQSQDHVSEGWLQMTIPRGITVDELIRGIGALLKAIQTPRLQ